MAQQKQNNSNRIIEGQLDEHLISLEKVLNADVLVFSGPIVFGVDTLIRAALDTLDNKNTKLVVILETTGGYIQVVERIVYTFRKNYRIVDFIIPNYAMSAGTVLVMSGDAIYMDYYSVLGPIDPQVQRPNSENLIPALGYLEQYNRLIEKSAKGELTTAELGFLIQKFDPAELYYYEQSRELSITLLKEWLVKYKFKNWKKTKTRQIKVKKAMRTARAASIAKQLNNTKKWHLHGRGITMEVLQKDLKLKIEDFEQNVDLSNKIKTYYGLLVDYMMRRGQMGILHVRDRYSPFN